MPVKRECVTGDDSQVVMPIERRGQSTILFNRNHSQPTSEQFPSEGAVARPDLDYRFTRSWIEGIGNAGENGRITEEMLAQPASSQALSRTRVRSSLAGAPPVKAAMSVKTASRISRAGLARRFFT